MSDCLDIDEYEIAYVEGLEQRIEQLQQQVDGFPKIEYQSKASGLWYTNPKSAGAVDSIKLNGIMFKLVGLEASEEIAKLQQQVEKLKDENEGLLAAAESLGADNDALYDITKEQSEE